MQIRPAHPGEHEALNALSFRSVQECWSYPAEFMSWEPEAIAVREKHIENDTTAVLEHEGRRLGFYVIRQEGDETVLLRLMVAPEALRTGCGRALWDHAVEATRSRGSKALRFDADPMAEPFYHRMGAVTAGEHDWEPPMMPGWRLKKMRFEIDPR